MIDPQKLLTEPTAAPTDLIPSDPLAQTELWRELQTLATKRPLEPHEVRQMVAVTRALRRTNTGPAKAKTSKAKAKPQVNLDDILGD